MSALKEYVKGEEETKIVSKVREEYVEKYNQFLIEKGKISKGGIVVDVPCGTGDMAKAISEKINVGKFILVDVNPHMIDSARKKLSQGNLFVVGDAGDISNLVNEKVDTILCLNGLHQYIERKKEFLKGCFEILKPGGILIFDISTRGLNDDYTKEFHKIRKEELKNFVKEYDVTLNLPVWPDDKILKDYEIIIANCGLKLLERKEFITWKTVEEVLDGAIRIPGRSRPWLEGLDYEKRKEAFIYAVKVTLEKIGESKIEHNRIFFITQKPF